MDRSLAGTRGRLVFVAAFALVSSSCGGGAEAPREASAEAEAPRPEPLAASTQVVVGTAPVLPGGSPVIVVLQPREPAEFSPAAETPVMDQVQLTFIPSVLLVRTGEPAEFRNSDPELHNLNVKDAASRKQVFNVAIPTDGKYLHTIEKDGVYDVSCDIHPGMAAQIVATSTPYTVWADATGSFEIADVPPGPYTAIAYGTGKPIQRPVEVSSGRTEIDLTAP